MPVGKTTADDEITHHPSQACQRKAGAPLVSNAPPVDGARLTTIATDAELVSHRTEAWIVLGETTLGVAPSQSDRRREVVVVLGAARGEDGTILSRFAAREIIRGEDGVATGTRPLDVPDNAGALCGPLSELSQPDPPTPAERRAARATVERATKRMARGKAAFIRH
jgi:hypothetical protein